MYSKTYENQVRLLLRCLPLLEKIESFALKGGTAINFFIRNMPRLSVDIDLSYLPVESREETFANMQKDLEQFGHLIKSTIPNSKISMQISKQTGYVVRLFIEANGAQIKVEPSFIVRGALYPTEYLDLCTRAENEFEISIKNMRTLSRAEIYAGKICAALNRQHPRDLFDIYMLLKEEGITDEIRLAFVVYLAGDARPMHEILQPNLLDIEEVYERQFHRMTAETVPLSTLLQARKDLIRQMVTDLTLNERKFLLSLKQGNPEWDLLPFKNLEQLPALQWKLINIKKMGKGKHQQMIDRLREILEL